MWNKKNPPNYLLLTLYNDDTYIVDFFDKKDRAETWMKDGKGRENIEHIAIYAPVKEEKE